MKRDILAKPRYIPAIRQKTLAYIDESRHCLVTEHHTTFSYTSQEEFLGLCIEHDLLLFISSLASFSYLDVFIQRGKVFCEKDSKSPLFASLAYGKHHKTISVVVAASWGYRVASLQMLQDLRALFDFVDLGVFVTPGSMGYAVYCHLQFNTYGEDWKKHRHVRPTSACCDFLEQTKRGARVEVFAAPDVTYLHVDELDYAMAYPDAYRLQPKGRSVYFEGESYQDYAYFIADCRVTLPHDFPYGLVGSKEINGEKFEEMIFLKEAGTYDIAIGKLEVDLLENAGCTVDVLQGYGWREMTDDTEVFTDFFEYLRTLHRIKRCEI